MDGMDQYSSRKIPQRIMGFRQVLGVMPNDRVSEDFSRLLTREHPGMWKESRGQFQPTNEPNFQKEGCSKGSCPQKPSSTNWKATPGFRSGSKQKMTQLRPASDLCNQRGRGGEGWTVHCYANEMQKNFPNSRRPLQQWLRRISQDASATCARH